MQSVMCRNSNVRLKKRDIRIWMYWLHISREKLAYIIDATAVPVCIIAPVSSWAVAVASEVSPTDGFHVFLSTIPTICMRS